MKKIFGAAEKKLHRIKFAGLTLDGLKLGKFRELTAEEISRLKGELS